MGPTAKNLILDLLSTLRQGAMPVRALVAAGVLFAISENSLRVALARLLAAGTVERDERGRYRLGGSGEVVARQVGAWREGEGRVRPGRWDGGWLAVHTAALPRSRGRDAARRARALRLLGFRPLARGLALRPDNLRASVGETRAQLRSLGLPDGARVFRVRDLDEADERRARRLWDVAALRAGYAESRRALAASSAALPGLPPEAAMVETFLLGGRTLRQLALDPLLPEPIAPAGERRALVDAMRDYDRLGRSAWAAFLARFDVPHIRNPVDLRVAEDLRPAAATATGEAA